MPVLFLVVVPWRARWPRFWAVSGVFSASAFVVALPIGLYFIAHPDELFARTADISVFAREQPIYLLADNVRRTIGMLFVEGDPNWRHNYAGRPQLFWPVAALLVVGVVRAVYELYRDGRRSAASALLLGWAALAILPVALSTDALPHALRSILLIPPVLLLAADAGVALASSVAARAGVPRLWHATAALVCTVLVAESYYTYFVRYAPRPEVEAAFNANYVAIGRAIEQLPPSTRKIVVDDAPGVPIREHRAPTQTVMFITDTFDPQMAALKNIVYVDPEELEDVEPGVIFHLK
jgi:hypothetical protein